MSEAGFETPATMPDAGLPEELLRHEIMGDEDVVQEILEHNLIATMEMEKNGDAQEVSDFLFEKDSSDEEDTVVKIGDIRNNYPFQKQSISGQDKIDMDGQPTVNGTMIYDLDLATMEEKPWQKPGADITDYFNYGFNEETWNSYCERQRKLRAEYGTQKEVNRAIVGSININFNPQQSQPSMMNVSNQGGRQLINVVGPEKPQKANKMSFDLTKPPPLATLTPKSSILPSGDDESVSPTASNVPVFNASIPPPNFNPSVPPPGLPQRTSTIPSVNLNVPPPMFNQPMYAFAGFNQQPPQDQSQPFRIGGPSSLMGADYSSTSLGFEKHERTHSPDNSDEDYNRRKRRRRSRSSSPRREVLFVRKEDKSRDYRESKSSSSRSSKRRDDRDKRRDRDDDYEKDRKRRKYDRSERSKRYNDRHDMSPEAPPGMEPE